MRLIDADAIEINEECMFSGKEIKAFLDAIPTTFDVDKVMEIFKEQIKENVKIHSMARFEWLAALEIIEAEIQT